MIQLRMRGALLATLIASAALAAADPLPLWEVEGISNHVYLLGSIHVLREGDSLPQGVVDAYGSADVLIMEMDLDKVDPMATAQITQQLGIDPQGKTLDELLGPADYASASRKASAIGIDLTMLRAFEPWLAAVTIEQLRLQQLGLDPGFGVEQQLIHKAHDDHKEIRGLETMEEQLGALAGLSPRAQRAFLMQTLDEAKSIDNEVEEIVSAWRTGNTQVLEKDFLKDLRDQPELYQRIVVQRNRNWIRQITALTRERRNYLVIVGTMHLVGRDSLLQMLAGAGVRTHQIQAKH
jgi:uncharacterized protein YbaP (TraB family)